MTAATPSSRPTVSQGDWSLQRKGSIDRVRHNEKVKEAIRKNLPEIIADESLITGDGKRIVKVPIRSLDEPRFRFGDGHKGGVGQGPGGTKAGDVVGNGPPQPGEGQGKRAGDQPGVDYYEAEFTIDELTALVFADLGLPNLAEKVNKTVVSPAIVFTDIRRTGAMGNLAKKQTIMENLRRNARAGDAKIGGIKPEDLRFKAWDERTVPKSGAVILAMMDVSYSMGDLEKYLARAFYHWMLAFLRSKYDNVAIVFIAHHTEAKEVTEEEFFTRGESGGTMCSSAYQLAVELTETRYRPEDWNIYPFHFSDGDNWGSDNDRCLALVEKLLAVSSLCGYGEIRAPNPYGYGGTSTLMATLKRIADPRFSSVTIRTREDVLPALRHFFGPLEEKEKSAA